MSATLIIFIAILSLLVFVHEFGHFIVAKKTGVRVEEFGFGFPPRMMGIKRGETLYSLNWIPLGGFVKIKGEAGEHGRDKDSFANKKIWQRIFIVSAGVIMNIVLAWFLLTIGYVIGMPQVVENLSSFAHVEQSKIQIISVLENSPADKAGFKAGDILLTIDGNAIDSVESIRQYADTYQNQAMNVTAGRGTGTVEKKIIPEIITETGRMGIGVALVKTGLVSYPLHIAPIEGASATFSFGKEILTSFYGLIHDFLFQRKVTVEFSGPIGIAVLTSEVAKLGFRYLLQFTALLSLNLAIINILPFPALDGGRVFFLLIEQVRGKSLGRKFEAITHTIGFALLMILVIVVTFRDVTRFGDRIIEATKSMFGG